MQTEAKATGEEVIRDRITTLLTDFSGGLTHSMLSVHIAPYGNTYGVAWRTVLDEMIREKIVIERRYESASGSTGKRYELNK